MWPDSTACPGFKENLSLSFDYLQNHMELDLWEKINEDIKKNRGSLAYGGSLVFTYMMERLQANSMLVIGSLQSILRTLRIDGYEEKDISKLVGHVKSIIRRLKTLGRKTKAT